jgi:hypothetical protein
LTPKTKSALILSAAAKRMARPNAASEVVSIALKAKV